MNIKIPHKALALIDMLEAAGFEAYVVGGCVRDALLGRQPNDWDVCTSAKPEQVKAAALAAGYAVFDTGIAHGTVTVHVDHETFEVTTYRSDGSYSDGRHPDSVSFLETIEGDLSRRDFTVNAMAYHPRRGLVDLHGGRQDLEQRIIRCVGCPGQRFQEDGLRIIRALRFSSVLGFDIDPETAAAVHRDRMLLGNAAAERISVEFMKLICGEDVADILLEFPDVMAVFLPQVEPMFGHQQRNPYHCYDVWEHCVRSCAYIEPDPTLRLAALLHDVGKPSRFYTDEDGVGHFYGHAAAGEPIAREACRALRLPRAVTDEVCLLVARHDARGRLDTVRSIRRFALSLEPHQVRSIFKLIEADMATHSPKNRRENLAALEHARQVYEQELENRTAFKVADLAVTGRDLMEAGLPQGPQLGEMLQKLLVAVVDDEVPNEKGPLLEYMAAHRS